MAESVVVTGIGLVTPLGSSVGGVLDRIDWGDVVASHPAFDTTAFACPYCARVADFDPETYFPESKTLRLMDRGAQMAAAAAHMALEDAAVRPDETYPAQEIALYGSTGASSLPVSEISRIVGDAAGQDGSLDMERFGRLALRRVRPVLSFRILANMPVCFVSILLNIRGPNAVYTPWEGQGAQAIAAGVRAIKRGDVSCALVGGCDAKTCEIAFIHLMQSGLFESWRKHGKGSIPGEGAAFLVLESEARAVARGRQAYARVVDYALRSVMNGLTMENALSSVVSHMGTSGRCVVVGAGDGEAMISEAEEHALVQAGLIPERELKPKRHLGNLYAAAAAVQVALAAGLCSRGTGGRKVLANCFGHGSEQGVFVLEEACVEL